MASLDGFKIRFTHLRLHELSDAPSLLFTTMVAGMASPALSIIGQK